jgi:hypothetical protein
VTELLKTVDNWFLILAVILLGGYFLWSVQRLFRSLQDSLDDLKKLIGKLFDMRNDHETRITTLETRCEIMHGDDTRPGGRRYYDPEHYSGTCK